MWLGDWGLAVILFTVLVRICLLPISIRTAKLAANQFVFSKKAAALQKNWKGTKEELAWEVTQLATEHKFNPLSLMLNALMQSPILMSVYALFAHLGPSAHSSVVPWVNSIGFRDSWHLVPILAAFLNGLTTCVSLIPKTFLQGTGQNQQFSFFLMVGISLLVLWSAPVATALYYVTSSLWGALERFILSGYVRKRILQQIQLEEL
jgi:YidC/Oxa1 family membrane protein insertase